MAFSVNPLPVLVPFGVTVPLLLIVSEAILSVCAALAPPIVKMPAFVPSPTMILVLVMVTFVPVLTV